jgi:uncharacterized protein (DUF1778 family)
MARTDANGKRRGPLIQIRASHAQCQLFDRAASVVGKSRSEFVLEASTQAADAVLRERGFLRVDPESFDRFAALLDEPPPPSDALRDLLARPAPWE